MNTVAQTFQIGTLAGWLTLVSIVAIAVVLWRGKAGEAVGILRDANEVLADRVKELEAKVSSNELTITELRAKTDVTMALQPLIEWAGSHEGADERRHVQVADSFKVVTGAIARHEDRADERHKASLAVLDLIAARLGPEPNGTT